MMAMEIKYLGHSSFRIKTGKAVVVTDPFDSDYVGLPFGKIAADIVTISHHHKDHDDVSKITGTDQREKPLVLDAPGEYEALEVGLVGISSFHDDKEGAERGKNTIFVIQADGVLVAHLGDLGHQLSDKQIEELGVVDVLLIPVGGKYTLDPAGAVKLINAVGPSIVVPMHYKADGMGSDFDEMATLAEFLSKGGYEVSTEEDKLKVTRESLPEETEVVILRR